MKYKPKQRHSTDAIEIIHDKYFKDRPEMMAMLAEERANAEIASRVYKLRSKHKITQSQLAKLIGTTTSVICRLEDANYYGHSVRMLQKIAAALKHRLEVRFVPVKAKKVA